MGCSGSTSISSPERSIHKEKPDMQCQRTIDGSSNGDEGNKHDEASISNMCTISQDYKRSISETPSETSVPTEKAEILREEGIDQIDRYNTDSTNMEPCRSMGCSGSTSSSSPERSIHKDKPDMQCQRTIDGSSNGDEGNKHDEASTSNMCTISQDFKRSISAEPRSETPSETSAETLSETPSETLDLTETVEILIEKGKDKIDGYNTDSTNMEPENNASKRRLNPSIQRRKPKTNWFDQGVDKRNLTADSKDLSDDDGDQKTVRQGLHKTIRTATDIDLTPNNQDDSISYDDSGTHEYMPSARTHSKIRGLVHALVGSIMPPDQEVKIVRNILAWMRRNQDCNDIRDSVSDESPEGLMQKLKRGEMTYAACFAILCGEAEVKLTCKVINGRTKTGICKDQLSESAWNAVLINNSWQIIHPFWFCRSMCGIRLKGWIKQGDNSVDNHQTSCDTFEEALQEYHFLPDHEAFLYQCLPNESEWQLVEKPLTSEQFIEQPYLFPPFHDLGLKILSESKCLLESIEGICRIELESPRPNTNALLFSCDLFQIHTDDDGRDSAASLSRMVLNSRSWENVLFDIRFPRKGIYKLVIYGGPLNASAVRLCEFMITCRQKFNGCVLFPITSTDLSCGYGPHTKRAGLYLPLRPGGRIVSQRRKKNQKTEIDIAFRLHGIVLTDRIKLHQFSVEVHEVTKQERQIDSTVDHQREAVAETSVIAKTTPVDKNTRQYKSTDLTVTITENELHVQVTLSSKVEYGLIIYEHVMKNTGKFEAPAAICKYLMTTIVTQEVREQPNVVNAKESMYCACLESRPESGPISKMKKAIEKCEKQITNTGREKDADIRGETKDEKDGKDADIRGAEDRLRFLECQKLFRECLNMARYDTTNKALVDLKKPYEFSELLSGMIRALECHADRLRVGSEDVPDLDKALYSLARQSTCTPDVLNLMKAVLMLLAEKSEEWSDITKFLKQTEKGTPVARQRINRISSDLESSMDKDVMRRVTKLLRNIDGDKLKEANINAYSFFIWAESIERGYRQQHGHN